MEMAYATPELLAALAKFQGEVENATKGSTNPHFRSKYADLAEVLNTIRPVLSANGLSLIQSTEFDGSLVSVETVIAHAGGGYISSRASCVPAKSDAQGIGAATTYLRRYGSSAITGIAQEDDDGQAASHTERPGPVATKAGKADLPSAEKAAGNGTAAFRAYWTTLTPAGRDALRQHTDRLRAIAEDADASLNEQTMQEQAARAAEEAAS